VDRLDGAYSAPASGQVPDERESIARIFAAMIRDGQAHGHADRQAQHPGHDVGQLHDAICRFVDRMRGDPPELVIIALKETLDRVPARGTAARYARDLAATAVRLCIAEYYRPSQRAD
jgi:hypothetical protein